MPYAPVSDIAASAIPVIDVAPLFSSEKAALADVADRMLAASESIGFFYIRNHRVPRTVIDAVVADAFAFFRRPQDEKLQVRVSPQHRGFIPVGEAKMYRGAKVDLKESFIWGLERVAANRWPAFQPGMRPLFEQYFDACHAVAWRLMRAFATALGIAEDYFVRSIANPISRGSAVYYPAQAPDLGTDQFGVAPHTDYGCLTLVYQANVGGLEVLGRGREWVLAHRIEDTFVVNVGDLLARWTNDRFRSTPHRVVNRSGAERLSLAVFVDPDDNTRIEPVCRAGEAPRYPPVTCGEYIRGRFDNSFAYRQK
jgi:isopenicillin N synthase-like dioxygenase